MRFERYAVYYCPNINSELSQFGNAWLGWNPETGNVIERPPIEGLSQDDIIQSTLTPTKYGFHGTLKPPFRLAENKSFDQLDLAMKALADQTPVIETAPLILHQIAHFLAFSPCEGKEQIEELAKQCVCSLDAFRKPASQEELIRRRQGNLTTHQDALLLRWGYPYVLDEFRFHLTLTNNLPDDTLLRIKDALIQHCEDILTMPFIINEICLFGDPGKGEPFHLIKRYPLSTK